MKNLNTELKLQALLDGELAPEEAKLLNDLLLRDSTAQALFTELQQTKACLSGNEPEIKLPESPEFYWSKISRQIERETEAVEPTKPFYPWLRWLAPLTGTAALAVILALTLKLGSASRWMGLKATDEFEVPLADSSVISFRSESEGISVVWVNTR